MFDQSANLVIFPLLDLIFSSEKATREKRILNLRAAKNWKEKVTEKDMAGALLRLHHLINRLLEMDEEQIRTAKIVDDSDFDKLVCELQKEYDDFFVSAKKGSAVDSAAEKTRTGETTIDSVNQSSVTSNGFLLGGS
tara:strand:+ start:1933 stop:2343 length:411 start_codon:yes stop_codon:yes gene_type:complete